MKWKKQKTDYTRGNNPNYRGGKEVPCTQCGTKVYRKPSDLKKRKNIFCSPKCHDDFRRKPKDRMPASEIKGYKHPRWNGIVKLCKNCKKELIGRNERKRNYCSDECAIEGRKKQFPKGKDHPSWKGGKIEKDCRNCGKKFYITPARDSTSFYCSRKCYEIDSRTRVTLKCEHCGGKFIVAYARARDENPRFCSISCYRSYTGKTSLESKVLLALEELELKYIDEYTPKGVRWSFDFYLPNLNILIEADGDFWHYSEWAEINGSVERDRKKSRWAKKNGYTLIRLKESDVNNFGALELLKKELGLIEDQNKNEYLSKRQ